MPSWDSLASSQWPFVGRDELLTLLRALWSGGFSRGVLVEGQAGVGKTRLVDEFGQSLGDGVLLRCVGTPATQTTPYAAIAHLIPPSLPPKAIDDPRQVLQAVRAELAGVRRVLMADDIVFLDEPSLSLFAHLVGLGELFLVGTVRVGHMIPPGLDSMIRSFGLHRMTVEVLDDAAVEAAASAVLGAPLEPASAQRMVDSSGGNPLYLRELLLQAVAADAVTVTPSGHALVRPVAVSAPRLVELVGARLAAVPDELLALLQMIAVAEPLAADDLERAGLTDDAVRLEQLGWIRADRRGDAVDIRVAHPLHSEVLRAAMGTIEHRRQVARAAEILRARPVPERDDALRIALWELDAGLESSPAVLLEGARRARAAVDLASCVRLASAAYRAGREPEAQKIWLETLFLLSRFEEADEVGAMPLAGPVDIGTLVPLMMIRMDNLLWGVGDAARALALVESYRPAFAALGIEFLLAYPEAFIRSVDGQTGRALELLGEVPSDPTLFLLSSLAHVNARTSRGRFAEVEQLCQRGLDTLAALPDPRAVMDPLFFRVTRGLARVRAGRFAEVHGELVLAYGAVVEERHGFLRCFIGQVTGLAALFRGHLTEAEQWFTETEAAAHPLSLPTARRVATAGQAAVAGQRGDAAAAADWLERLDALPGDVAYLLVETQLGRSWALHCLGRPKEARDGMRAAIEQAINTDEPVSALFGLVESCRLGDGRWACEQIDRVRDLDQVEGPFAAAQAALVRAFGGRAGDPFLAAAQAFHALDAHLHAAEAASLAAAAFERDGQRRGAAAARSLAAGSLASCDPIDTPALRAAPPAAGLLSSRELEVARLAAQGHSSKSIAERLYLSTRTVDNHLQRVYAKLGVNGRDDLGTVLS